MPKDHARKSSARRRAYRTGSSYTSANARTVHEAPTPTVWLAGRSWPHGLELVLRDGGRRLTFAMPAGGGKTTVAASGLSQAQPTAKTLLLVPDAAALRDVIKTWRLHCDTPIATLKVVTVGQGSTAALATARDVALWMAAQGGGAILVACHDDAEVIASSHLDHQLPPWDQMVIEEAHRTAAEPVTADHPYAAIHYDDAIPAFARLYLTATPQILPTPTARDGEVDDGGVDMPGNQLFGHIQPSVSRTELVRKGLLSPTGSMSSRCPIWPTSRACALRRSAPPTPSNAILRAASCPSTAPATRPSTSPCSWRPRCSTRRSSSRPSAVRPTPTASPSSGASVPPIPARRTSTPSCLLTPPAPPYSSPTA